MLDVVVRVTDTFAPTSDTPSRVRVSRGGSGANLAISLIAAGHDVDYVGAVGDDAAGVIVRQGLQAAGLNPCLEEVEGSTGTVVALVAEDAQRAMLTDRGVNSRLSVSFVRDQLARPFDHVHVSGYLLLDSLTRALASEVLATARARGASSSLDACSVAPLRRMTPQAFLDAGADASMIFANEEEALELSGADDATTALEFLARAFGDVLVTTGPRGALAAHGDERREVNSSSRVVLDTTGAGDAASGAFLGARLHGASLSAALDAAMAASARVVAALGAEGYSRA